VHQIINPSKHIADLALSSVAQIRLALVGEIPTIYPRLSRRWGDGWEISLSGGGPHVEDDESARMVSNWQ